MQPLTHVQGVAALLDEDNVDTDAIFPARFLLRLEREGAEECLFHDRRFAKDGTRNPDFVLNRAPFDRAAFLVAGANFGCGSSREQAVWALVDAGIRCVIAPRFGDIFFNNAAKNGLLAIVLTGADFERVRALAERGATLAADVARGILTLPDGAEIAFAIEPHTRRAMLEGLDEAGFILSDCGAQIDAFEARHRQAYDWAALDVASVESNLDLHETR